MTQDLYYVDSGYLTPDSNYYVYIADAEAAVSSQATMTVTVGVIKDCQSTITCQATVSAVISHIHGADLVAFSNAAIATEINVIRTTNVQLTSVFSAAIDGSRGIYVSAQADSMVSLDITNLRVRFTEAAIDAAFALTCDATKILGGTVEEADATLFNTVTLNATVERFAGVEATVSSTAETSTLAERIRLADSTIQSEYSLSIDSIVIKDVSASISSLVTLTVDANRIRLVDSANTSAFTPTLIVDIFKNSFAVLDSPANLSAEFIVTRSAASALTTNATVSASASKSVVAAGALSSQFTIYASRNFGSGRPRNLVNGGVNYTTTSKFGSHSAGFNTINSGVSSEAFPPLDITKDFYMDGWIRTSTLSTGGNYYDAIGFTFGPVISIRNGNVVLRVRYYTPSLSPRTAILYTHTSTISTNTWHHVAVVITDYEVISSTQSQSQIAFYLNGTRLYQNNLTYIDGGAIGAALNYGIADVESTQFRLQFYDDNYKTDEARWFQDYTFGYNAVTDSTIAVPTVEYKTPDTLDAYLGGLYHLNNSIADDTSLAQTFSGTLSSAFTTTASLTGPQNVTVALSSTAFINCIGSELSEINLTAFSDAALTTNGERLRFADVSQSSEFTQITSADRLRTVVSQLSSEFALSANLVVTRNAQSELLGFTTELVLADRFASTSADLTASFNQSTTAVKVTDYQSNLSSAASLDVIANRIREVGGLISSQATQSVDLAITRSAQANWSAAFSPSMTVSAVKNTFAVLDASASLAVSITKTTDYSADLSVSCTLAMTPKVTRDFAMSITDIDIFIICDILKIQSSTATMEISSDLAADNTRIPLITADLTAVSAVSATSTGNIDFIVAISGQTTLTVLNQTIKTTLANLASTATVDATISTVKTASIATDAIFTELVAIAKTGQGFITLDSQSSQTTVAVKTATVQVNCTVNASMSVTASRTRRASATFDTSEFKQNTLAGNLVSAVAVTVPFVGLPIFGWFSTVTATINATRTRIVSAEAAISSSAALDCDPVKTAVAISIEASAGTLSATGGIIYSQSAALSALAFELVTGFNVQNVIARITAQAALTAAIGGTFGAQANLSGFASELVVADIIHIDAKLTWMIIAEDRSYAISAEDRTSSIQEEDREYSVIFEDRTYKVTRELLEVNLQG